MLHVATADRHLYVYRIAIPAIGGGGALVEGGDGARVPSFRLESEHVLATSGEEEDAGGEGGGAST